MIIEFFEDFYDAILFIETNGEMYHEYFKAEITKVNNGWRVGIVTEAQIEMEI